MIQRVYEFFGIIGVDIVPPQTLGELIPYLLQIGVGLVLVAAVFYTVRGIASVFSYRGWL